MALWVALNAAARRWDHEGPLVLCFPGAGAFVACDYAQLAAAVNGMDAAVYALQLPRAPLSSAAATATGEATAEAAGAWLTEAVQQYLCLRNGRAQIAVAHSLGGIIFRAFAGELLRQTGTADGFQFDRLVLGASSLHPAYFADALHTDADADALDALWAAATDAVYHHHHEDVKAKAALAHLGKTAFVHDLRLTKALMARPCAGDAFDGAAAAALVPVSNVLHVIGDTDPFAHDLSRHLARTNVHVVVLPQTGHRLAVAPAFVDTVRAIFAKPVATALPVGR